MRTAVRFRTLIATLTLVGVSLVTSSISYADWGYGSGGSWGGSGGSRGGSWGASRGGSSGGGPLRRFAARIHSVHHRGYSAGSSGGSSGGRYATRSWGSSGGSSGGSYVVRGSSGGSSGGSNGGSVGGSSGMYNAPAYVTPVYSDGIIYGNTQILTPGPAASQNANPTTPVDANKAPVSNPPADGVVPENTNPQSQPSGGSTDTSISGDARLRIRLPADAVVFVNGRRTKTAGETRSYVSRKLQTNRVYPYEVKAVVVRDGQELVQTKVVDLSAGMDKMVDFRFDEQSEVLTSLSLSVPDDARVVLGGTATSVSGSFRYFSTKALNKGQVWSDYAIVVTVVRDGKEITRRQVVTLAAGDSKQLAFNFDEAEALVAAK